MRNFSCPQDSGLSISWTAESVDGDSVALSPANQAASLTLFLPPKFLPSGIPTRFLMRVCYLENPDPVLCDVASRDFMVRSTMERATSTRLPAYVLIH